MIGGRRVLAIVPARGGSKGLPGKNVLLVEGRPLLAWTIDAARAARVIDRIVLSSDDEAIMTTARACGCEVPFRRPAELATDTATSIDVVMHALDQLPGYELVLLLQPTSPLRTAGDIEAAAEKLAASRAPACVSVRASEETPFWMYFLGADDSLRAVIETPDGMTRRQDLPSVYTLNGAIYLADTQWLRRTRTFVTPETVGYVMPPERSLDIDTRADFEAFKTFVSRKPHADPVPTTP